MKKATSSPGEGAVQIRHGNAPEIRTVNIAMKKKRTVGRRGHEHESSFIEAAEAPFRRRRPVSKTMTTTKSTMTNEEDYQIDIGKYIEEDNANHTAISHNIADPEPEPYLNEVIHVSIGNEEQQTTREKPIAWKIAPKVHFPLHDDSVISSPIPTESLYESHYQSTEHQSAEVVEWDHLRKSATIEPTYEHRPDKSYLVHQQHNLPANPLKAWPGYGGNVYFEPVLVESKPIYERDAQDAGTRTRSRATSRQTYGDTISSPDGFSDSRYLSMPPPTPIHPGTRKDTPIRTHRYINPVTPTEELSFQRQMAHLDRDYILSMKANPKLHEDWSWISGLESIGTLCIGDGSVPLQRNRVRPYTRTLVVEKIPHKFTYHPGNNDVYRYRSPRPVPLVHVKIKSQVKQRSTVRKHPFPKQRLLSARLAQGREIAPPERNRKQRVNNRRQTRLPAIPIRVEGEKVSEMNIRDPWRMNDPSRKRNNIPGIDNLNNVLDRRSRIADFLSKSRARLQPADERKKFQFSVRSLSRGPDNVDCVTESNDLRPADYDTDDEDRVSYDTLHSAYFRDGVAKTNNTGSALPSPTY